MSFAPDGTQAGGGTSVLFQQLDPLNVEGNDWQLQILKALQTWAVNANINVSVTSDGEQAFGTPGALQGDSRFGDIRVGATPQGSMVLAQAQPFSYTAGTWAGDINFNSTQPFGINQPNQFDLYSVALHEAGHLFGLDDNTTDPTSVMYGDYTGSRTGPSASDFSALQAIYGARTLGSDEGPGGNDSLATAASMIMVNRNGSNAISSYVTIQGDISSLTDQDFYKVSISPSAGPTTISLETTGISSLVARLSVYDQDHQLVATSSSPDPRNGDLSINLSRTKGNGTYYVEVRGATGSVFGIGSYMLRATPDSVTRLKPLPWSIDPVTNGFINYDNHTNDTAATPLGTPRSTGGQFTYMYKGSLSDSADVDLYSFKTPGTIPAGAQGVLTAALWGLDALPVDSKITIFDSCRNPVTGTVLIHEGGTFVVQIPNAAPHATYFAKVQAYDAGGLNNLGNYQLAIGFGTIAESQTQLASGTLVQQANGGFNTQPGVILSLAEDTLYHFELSASNGGLSQAVFVQMTITDQAGHVVKTLLVKANQEQSLEIWLAAGTYTITLTGLNESGTTAAPLTWILSGDSLSDKIKAYLYLGGSTPPPP